MSLTEVKERVGELSPQERAELQEFLADLDTDQLSPELNSILERRVHEIRTGQAKLVSSEEVFAELERIAS